MLLLVSLPLLCSACLVEIHKFTVKMVLYPSLYAPMHLNRKELNDLVPSRAPDIWAAEDDQTVMTALHTRCESLQPPASSSIDRARLVAAVMQAIIKHSERIMQTQNINLKTFQAADQQKRLLRTLLLNVSQIAGSRVRCGIRWHAEKLPIRTSCSAAGFTPQRTQPDSWLTSTARPLCLRN